MSASSFSVRKSTNWTAIHIVWVSIAYSITSLFGPSVGMCASSVISQVVWEALVRSRCWIHHSWSETILIPSQHFCLVFVLYKPRVIKQICQCSIDINVTFFPSGSEIKWLFIVRSDVVELHPELPLVATPQNSLFEALSCQTSQATLDGGNGRLVSWWLSVKGSLVFYFSIAAFVVSFFAFGLSMVESILVLQYGVVKALEGFRIVIAAL